MITITKPSANRIDIDLDLKDGTLDGAAMRLLLEDLFEKSKDIANGKMLYKISSVAFPTLGALGVELSHLPGLFGLITKFDKCAVCCDTAWIRKIGEIEGMLFPGMEIKSFEFDDTAAAEAWLAAPNT